jgi:hypothetical protein
VVVALLRQVAERRRLAVDDALADDVRGRQRAVALDRQVEVARPREQRARGRLVVDAELGDAAGIVVLPSAMKYRRPPEMSVKPSPLMSRYAAGDAFVTGFSSPNSKSSSRSTYTVSYRPAVFGSVRSTAGRSP